MLYSHESAILMTKSELGSLMSDCSYRHERAIAAVCVFRGVSADLCKDRLQDAVRSIVQCALLRMLTNVGTFTAEDGDLIDRAADAPFSRMGNGTARSWRLAAGSGSAVRAAVDEAFARNREEFEAYARWRGAAQYRARESGTYDDFSHRVELVAEPLIRTHCDDADLNRAYAYRHALVCAQQEIYLDLWRRTVRNKGV